MAEKLKVIALGAAVAVVRPGPSGKPTLRQIGFDEGGKPVLEPATSIVFLEKGDDLPDHLADGEVERLQALVPPAVGTQADLDYFEARLRNDDSPVPLWAQAQTSYPGTIDEAPSAKAAKAAAELGNLGELSDAQLVELYAGKPPTVQSLLAAVGDDKELAARVLQAEETATKGDPRSSLKAGLDKVIAAEPAVPES